MACATLKRSWGFEQVHTPELPNKRPRYTPMSVSPSTSQAKKSSVFEGCVQMTTDDISQYIQNETEMLKRRKCFDEQRMNMSPTNSESSSNSDCESTPRHTKNIKTLMFSYKQVQQICNKIVKEREEQLRKEYEEILNNKLSEQYDMFVRFSRDQIHKHFSNETPSYLS